MDEELIRSITSAATEVHHLLGEPELLETVYEAALCHELFLRDSQRQLEVPVVYKSAPIREPMFLDILVEGRLIIEVKATGKDYPIYHAQLSTYMRLTGVKLGLLINFGKQSIQDGIIRMIDK